MKLFLFICLSFFSLVSFSQDSDSIIYDFPDKEAKYPGGVIELKKFILENLVLPDCGREFLSKIHVEFVIEKDGSISNVKHLKGGCLDFQLEVTKVVELMPKWIPAEFKGEIVRSRVRIPILIHLN